MSSRKNVLFLCTGNSSRSIMAEAILNDLSINRGNFQAFSAGSAPTGLVNTFALEQLEKNHLSTSGLRSKSWEEFTRPDAPKMHFVFTVCDAVAGESCPVWQGQPLRAHWGIPDPAAVEGSDLDRRRAFVAAFNHLRNRISLLTSLPLEKLDREALQSELDSIGRSD